MSLFRRKCEYCKEKIERDKEIFMNVKVPVFVGTRKKSFCCEEHANSYEKEVEEYLKNGKSGGSCCG